MNREENGYEVINPTISHSGFGGITFPPHEQFDGGFE